jgi:hypothetical protein
MVGTDCGCDVNLFSRYMQEVHFILVRNVLLSQSSCGPRSSSACTYASFWIFPIYKCCKTDAQMWQNIITLLSVVRHRPVSTEVLSTVVINCLSQSMRANVKTSQLSRPPTHLLKIVVAVSKE